MSYHKYVLFTGGLHLVLYGAGFQYFMGYQSHSHFLLPSGWPANRQASGSQQARVAEEDNFRSRFCPVPEMTGGFYVILRSLNVSFLHLLRVDGYIWRGIVFCKLVLDCKYDQSYEHLSRLKIQRSFCIRQQFHSILSLTVSKNIKVLTVVGLEG